MIEPTRVEVTPAAYKDSFIKRDGIWRFAEGKHEPDLAVSSGLSLA